MKPLRPVDEETYARIGKAYQICSEYPEVFGDVTMKQFCAMFVDVVDEEEDEREVRMKSHSLEMYQILKAVYAWTQTRGDIDEDIEADIYEVLSEIDGGEMRDE